MSHSHKNCTIDYYVCTEGQLTSYCEDDNCYNEFCMDYGHCKCKCHSGKKCGCGYQWERMEKQ